MRYILLTVLAGLLWCGTASASTQTIQSTSDDPDWLAAHGLTPVATLTVEDMPNYKLPDRCWHARVFAGLNAYNQGEHKYAAWATLRGIVCSLNGHIREFHLRHSKGSISPWHDGPYPSLSWWKWVNPEHRAVHSHYQTDWRMGTSWQGPNWGVGLSLIQYWSKRVDRTVRWHHYPSS